MFRGAFGMTSTAASAPAKAKPKANTQDLYDRHYKKFLAKGMSPKQAAAFATRMVDRLKGS